MIFYEIFTLGFGLKIVSFLGQLGQAGGLVWIIFSLRHIKKLFISKEEKRILKEMYSQQNKGIYFDGPGGEIYFNHVRPYPTEDLSDRIKYTEKFLTLQSKQYIQSFCVPDTKLYRLTDKGLSWCEKHAKKNT